ncbi:MAG TPA: DNA-directed RNA polymerase subunit beta [Planctomycetota bacterium]|jgi:DNA-directed RNA polymerase subunit beta|nr:DNA-directed RNA polymerase subunit beta [Planctomycetota bacterium]OQC19597.1 MAG: DNA-directed RNA polymerase subunit beta [Planctomycetes bacterium ADurb.Bin069]NMD36628.1 DNA-directed RNA polymerase subunit beta [Planctomycetota bacterium]HNR99009.1 DNA-directed RNA polymerase subunit beta [Planctomycetota bacterium]HOE30238.1 DNA-directed RNA polymerase subunit beta [Planctomycetota bacterium]
MTDAIRIRTYGKVRDAIALPSLMDLQVKAWERFLQRDIHYAERENFGLESILREIFPIKSYDGKLSLEYIGYELSRPRYSPDECRKLQLSYGTPFKIRVRLEKEQPVEEEVYLGEIPLMIGGGEFVVNGAERVIVSQLHRSPGVDFTEEFHASEKHLHCCRIIPERGSWIEVNVTKKDTLVVRIDQSGRFAATTLLRAMADEYSTDEEIIKLFYKTVDVKLSAATALKRLKGQIAGHDINDPETGEVLLATGEVITESFLKNLLKDRKPGDQIVRVILEGQDALVLNTLKEDPARSHEEALIRIYQRLRPGNPPQLAKAKELFYEKFYNPNKYRLGRVGRFRINRKFGQQVPETEMTLNKEDLINSIRYILDLRDSGKEALVDDIDHLGNRRVRTIEELAAEEFRKGFLKLKRTVQERMSLAADKEKLTPRAIINSKTVSSAIEFFFARGELSQVVDQTNPLAQLTHERRLSALGPGGLNRKRAGFEVRDVHISHYGRICPIETPEGTNIGLISSLGTYAAIDEYGFLITPYRCVKNGKVLEEVKYLRADEEENRTIAPADTVLDARGRIVGEQILARRNGDFLLVEPKEIDYVDVSTKQLVGVSASLIPFLEHDDANRALMGSNMMRQAVPLIQAEAALVTTGVEQAVASNSGMVVKAAEDGVVTRADSLGVAVNDRVTTLRKFEGLNERTCLNQRPCVRVGDNVKAGQVIADGAATKVGELALGRNVLCAFMSWDGFNFEDAIVVSERLLRTDTFASVHINDFEIEIRETKLGREEFTREIPNVSERVLRNLDEDGVVRIGTRVGPGDILVGKVVPKSKSELTPEEKLLHAIFGRAGEDVKNDSLEVPPGVEGFVIGTAKFARRAHASEEERQQDKTEAEEIEKDFRKEFQQGTNALLAELEGVLGKPAADAHSGKPLNAKKLCEKGSVQHVKFALEPIQQSLRSEKKIAAFQGCLRRHIERLEALEDDKNHRINKINRGDELPTGVLEMVKVYVATKRNLSVGDKLAGRHGNKGVVARIVPEEDMPFLEDGTSIDIVLNPLGVPSRMNLGQILEMQLGWAASQLGFRAVCPVFDGAVEKDIKSVLKEAGLPESGKVTLYDGRTGEPFEQKVTVGYMYMLKLHHMVDDKIHARATGPYSLITQQPLGGKARFGGQRFGEMEVWALEAYGAANILQELLTVKSDDVDGRTKIYESMVKGMHTLDPGTPISFEVLCHEIRGLGLFLELRKEAKALGE